MAKGTPTTRSGPARFCSGKALKDGLCGRHLAVRDKQQAELDLRRVKAADNPKPGSVQDILSRTFIGPPNKKGRQPMYLATKAEAEAWHKANKSKPQDERRRNTQYH